MDLLRGQFVIYGPVRIILTEDANAADRGPIARPI